MGVLHIATGSHMFWDFGSLRQRLCGFLCACCCGSSNLRLRRRCGVPSASCRGIGSRHQSVIAHQNWLSRAHGKVEVLDSCFLRPACLVLEHIRCSVFVLFRGAQMLVERRIDEPCGRRNDSARKHCVHTLAKPQYVFDPSVAHPSWTGFASLCWTGRTDIVETSQRPQRLRILFCPFGLDVTHPSVSDRIRPPN